MAVVGCLLGHRRCRCLCLLCRLVLTLVLLLFLLLGLALRGLLCREAGVALLVKLHEEVVASMSVAWPEGLLRQHERLCCGALLHRLHVAHPCQACRHVYVVVLFGIVVKQPEVFEGECHRAHQGVGIVPFLVADVVDALQVIAERYGAYGHAGIVGDEEHLLSACEELHHASHDGGIGKGGMMALRADALNP